MNADHKQAFLTAFDTFYKGDANAITLSMQLLEVAHAWDDMIDGDEINGSKVNRIFRYLIYDIPTNPVYRLIPELPSHLLNVFLRWRDATTMEAEDQPDLEKTYMLRAGIYDIFLLIAYHLHGDQWAEEIGPSVRKLYGETLDSLKKEFT